jgi:microsomal epoxide hydrolase
MSALVSTVSEHKQDILADETDVKVLVNMYTTREEPDMDKLDDVEKKALAKASEWTTKNNAYAQEHGTRPSTIGHVLSSNPLALLAW